MNKQIVIIRTENGTKYAERISTEVKSLGIECNIVCWKELEKLLDNLTPAKALLHFRAAGPSANPKALELEKAGYRVINPARVLDRTSDKYKSFEWARKQGVVLPTTKRGTRNAIKRSIDTLPFQKFVVKPINSKNQGALCFPSFKGDPEIDEKLLRVPGEEIILQQYVEYIRIYRVIVIGGTPVAQAVFYDEPTPDRWKVSVCLNPEIQHEPNPDPQLLAYAKNLADIFESEIAFVDVFQTKDGYVLSEINTACNLTQHENKSGCNIAKKIAQYLVTQLRDSTLSRSSD